MKLGERLTEGPIFKKFVFFVVPVIISGFLQQLYHAADTVVVGWFAGDTALAAVGATSSLSALIITLFMGLSVGTNVVCAAFLVQRTMTDFQEQFTHPFSWALFLGFRLR